MGKQYLSIQVGTASGFADRYFQSFIAPGGISALGYVGLIVNNLSSLLTFREIYVVPLTTALNREQRLERMLQGLTLISVPIAVFLVIYAEPVVGVLLQRGRFTPEAVAVTAMLLRIQALSLVISTMSTPLERLLQIVDRLFFVQLRYIAAFVGTLVFQPLFVFYLRMDVQGVAWAGICSGVAVLAVVVVLVRRCGIAIGWRGVMVNAVYASGMAAAAAALSWPLASAHAGLTELIVAGAIYGAVMGLGYLIVRRRWLAVIG
jgi:putative peptidoglycan lipid II flippase